MNSCWIIPQIKNREGEWVDSKLYQDLLEATNHSRDKANTLYEYVHSDDFINSFGNWIDNPDNIKDKLDENGEPLIEYVDTQRRLEVSPYLRETIKPEEVHTESKEPEISLAEDILTDELSQLDRISEIRAKAVKALEIKLETQVRFKQVKDDDILEKKLDFIKKLSTAEAEQAMIDFVRQAATSTDSIIKQYNEKIALMKKEGKKFSEVVSPGLLYHWRDYLSAYDTIEDFEAYLLDSPELADLKIKNGKTLSDILAKTIAGKNAIKKLYETKGIDMVAEFLAPHYNKIFRDFEILVGKKYDSLSESDKAKISKDDFIRQQKSLNNEDLKKKTILLLKRELLKASKDINIVGRWVENTQDASDPVIAAAAKALGIAVMKSEAKTLSARDEIISSLREVEKEYGSSTNKKKFYDFMLETDENGNYTGSLVDRFGSKFWDAYSKVKEKAKKLETAKERASTIKTWVRTNTIFDKTGFNKARWEIIEQLQKEGKLSDQEVKELEWNDVSYTPLSAHQMYENNILNKEAADVISDWVYGNIWDYRQPTSEWKQKNPAWSKFEKIAQNPNDSRVKFYNVIRKYEKEAGSYLPSQMRLKSSQLPGIIKSNEERIQDKEPIKDLAKETIKKQFNIMADDTSRGIPSIQDEQGNEINFIPIHYTGKLDIKDQSFDLASIYLRYYQMAADFGYKSEILPQMQMTKFFINNRDIIKTDSKGNPIMKTYQVVQKKVAEKVTKSKGNNQLADQFNDWFEMVIYGKKTVDEGEFNIFGFKIDRAKFVDYLNKFTSLNVLALNFRAGISNITLGEALQVGEAFASQHMTKGSYNKANIFFWKNIMGVINDIGRRSPDGLVNKLYEEFQISPEPLDLNLKDNTRAKMLTKTSKLYFIMHAGDFYMQSRLFLGMLANKDAYDSKGNKLGSMLDMYSIKDGQLTLDSRVDAEKSNWTKEDQINFSFRTKAVMAGIHGEYSDIGRSAMQRYALGRLGIMFRKFIVPGLKRRYKKMTYIERMGDYTEGYYRTTGRFFKDVAKELRTVQLSAFGQEWNKLSKTEKANIVRTMSEVAFLTAAIILSTALLSSLKEGDDDDDKWITNFMAYQMLRFKTELLFYSPKIDEAMTLLRSPMATMATFENIKNLCHQLGSPGEVYQRGPWQGHTKIEKIMWDFIPGARAFFQTRDIKTQINFLR